MVSQGTQKEDAREAKGLASPQCCGQVGARCWVLLSNFCVSAEGFPLTARVAVGNPSAETQKQLKLHQHSARRVPMYNCTSRTAIQPSPCDPCALTSGAPAPHFFVANRAATLQYHHPLNCPPELPPAQPLRSMRTHKRGPCTPFLRCDSRSDLAIPSP